MRPTDEAEAYDFTHALIRHALYTEMSPSRQVRLHRRIAEELEHDDERRIVRLRRKLGVRSKAGLVRIALDELERRLERREKAAVIREYVRKHGGRDRRENRLLSGAGVGRDDA